MKIIEKHNNDFQAQFNSPRWMHSIKCVLLEKDQDPKYLTHNIKPEHLNPLFGTKFITAEVGDEEMFLSVKIKTEGIYFEGTYKIDFKSGEIEFDMDMPYLVKKEYVVPEDLDPELAERVKKFMKNRFKMANFADEEFNKYYSDKFMPVFVDYAGYLEKLIKEKNCEGCAYLYQHRLSRYCHNFYKINECKDSE